ncbi:MULTISPECIES: lytic transglycosylase domain-containing protein [Flavobacterium]|uniref:lytic transglycosylase domain-containing protein n=1 Tax=Flavobacterium TaxID=237 RepID=UPI001FCC90AD|nr:MULTISPECIES: lytic transglycosylase domain-containing protein [Flavobacterium]UOK42469.1 lytic transglycosylase domain-containing protein [Flavobacterium enshiense]
MKMIKRIAAVAAIVIVSGVFIYAASTTPATDRGYEFTRIPVDVDFAGEKVPLNISDVSERFDRELTVNVNLHATTELVIKRANRVFPVIESILKKNGVPDDFKYLAVIESGLVNVVSPSKATGVWQFMPETAKQMGMEVNDIVDERYHLEKSTELACQYLLKAKAKFGNWTMAAASYNGGMNGMDRFMIAQKVTDYYDLLVNEETSRYVFRILALKEIMQNQKKYGYELPAEILYKQIPTKKIEVSENIPDLATFAIEQGINYKILKIHNPWLRDKSLVVQPGKVYIIEIPLEGYTR